MAPKWECCRTPNLSIVVIVDTVWAPYITLWAGDVGHTAWALVDIGWRVNLRWRSGMLNKTSSHTGGDWYFPIFLLRDGSLTFCT